MIAVIRVRGTVNVADKISLTMENLRLFKTNHLVLVKDDKSSKKMVEKVNNPQPQKQVSGANQSVNPAQPGLVSRPDTASRPTVAQPSTAGQQGQQPPLVV